MKSNKQHKAELKAKRLAKAENAKKETKRAAAEKRDKLLARKAKEGVAVNQDNLAPFNSYGVPSFVARGFYEDLFFICEGCGSKEVWTGTQQKWWYEVAKGAVYSTAKLCRSCRRKKREGRLKKIDVRLLELIKQEELRRRLDED